MAVFEVVVYEVRQYRHELAVRADDGNEAADMVEKLLTTVFTDSLVGNGSYEETTFKLYDVYGPTNLFLGEPITAENVSEYIEEE